MSLYDDASLIVYPSGYKSGVIYSQKPTDGSGDLDFTRASTATRVNADGLIESVATGVSRIDYTGGGCGKFLFEPQRTNNLLQSNQFDTTWLNQLGGTIVGGQTNTIATSDDAWKLTKDAASGRSIRQIIALGSNTYTYSAFLKSGTLTTAALRIDTSSGASIINVDLSLGTITSEAGVISSSVVDFGGGWYKYSMTITDTVTNVHVYAGIIADTDAGDIFCQRTQLEAGSYPTSYIPTAGTTATRIVDDSTTTGLSALIGQTTGTVSVKVNASIANNTAIQKILDLYVDATNYIRIERGVSGVYAAKMNSGGTEVTIATSAQILGDANIVLTYQTGTCTLYINGATIGTNAGVLPIGSISILKLYGECNSRIEHIIPATSILTGASLTTINAL